MNTPHSKIDTAPTLQSEALPNNDGSKIASHRNSIYKQLVLAIPLVIALFGSKLARAEEQQTHSPHSVGAGLTIKGNPAPGQSTLGAAIDYAYAVNHHLHLKAIGGWSPIEEENSTGSLVTATVGPILATELTHNLEAGAALRGGVEVEKVADKQHVVPLFALCGEVGKKISKTFSIVAGLCGEKAAHIGVVADVSIRTEL